jgi:hypothetical protein
MISKEPCAEGYFLTSPLLSSHLGSLREAFTSKVFNSHHCLSDHTSYRHIRRFPTTATMANYLASIFGTEQDKGM